MERNVTEQGACNRYKRGETVMGGSSSVTMTPPMIYTMGEYHNKLNWGNKGQ